MNSPTAILIFANSSQDVGKFNSLADSNKLIEQLNASTLKTVKKTKLPYFLITEKEQCGLTFGERFENAIKMVFNKGYENVITIGNDTPQLKPQHILDAKSHLDKNNFIVGPSLDGGFYLMGIARGHFNKISFLELPWQTSYLQKSISLQITALGIEVLMLAKLQDIDSISDLKKIYTWAYRVCIKLVAIISTLLQISVSFSFISKFLIVKRERKRYFNKGSPIFLPI